MEMMWLRKSTSNLSRLRCTEIAFWHTSQTAHLLRPWLKYRYRYCSHLLYKLGKCNWSARIKTLDLFNHFSTKFTHEIHLNLLAFGTRLKTEYKELKWKAEFISIFLSEKVNLSCAWVIIHPNLWIPIFFVRCSFNHSVSLTDRYRRRHLIHSVFPLLRTGLRSGSHCQQPAGREHTRIPPEPAERSSRYVIDYQRRR